MKMPLLLCAALLLPTLLFAAEPPRQQLNFNREWKFQLGDQPGAEVPTTMIRGGMTSDCPISSAFLFPVRQILRWLRLVSETFEVPAKWAGQRLSSN